MRDKPNIQQFEITCKYTGTPFLIRAGDTLQVEFYDGFTGRRDVVLKEKITESGITDDIFIARAVIDGMPAKMGGFTFKKDVD